MKNVMRCLLALAALAVFAAPASSAPAAPATPAGTDTPYEALHVWMCEMNGETTEEQVDLLAQTWLKAIRQMPGGEAAKVQVIWPVAVANTGQIDFQFVVSWPSFTDYGKFWDAYTDDSPASLADDLTRGKVECPDSMLWEVHRIDLK